jgi:hypothetical protein
MPTLPLLWHAFYITTFYTGRLDAVAYRHSDTENHHVRAQPANLGVIPVSPGFAADFSITLFDHPRARYWRDSRETVRKPGRNSCQENRRANGLPVVDGGNR